MTCHNFSRRSRAAAAALALGTLAVTLVACSDGDDEQQSRVAAQRFLDAWARGDVPAAAGQTDDPAAARAGLQQAVDALSQAKGTMRARGGSVKDHAATIPFTASWAIPGVARPWTYDGSLAMVKDDDAWKVHWQPSDIHPRLSVGEKLVVTRALPERAALLDRDGAPLFSRVKVVTVGIKPRDVDNLRSLASTLATTLHISAGDILADVQKAKPDQFVPVITLREADYLKVRPIIHPLPGTVFQTGERLLGPTARFGQPFLGRVGQATAEVLKESGGQYVAGDELGLSGLQRALNPQLAGRAGATISVTSADGQSNAEGDAAGDGGDGGEVIARIDPVPGRPVKLTIDRRVQEAADAATATVEKNAAIVALRPSTGEILAVSNGPNVTFDMALAARVPAGSTFKIITGTAVLSAGVVRPDATVSCPGTIRVGGRTFHNEDSFELGQVPLRRAFAKSCNTTFIELGRRVDPAMFARTAARFGIGAEWNLPVTSFSGSMPPPKDDAERAADAIGQGRVLVSPLAMALVAATVQHGSTPTPSLISGTQATPKAPPEPPPAQALAAMRDFMRATVTEGTATDLASLPGEPAGKTGTAEYGTDVPPRSHAWFAGYRGDLAFAVFVEDGQSSHATAVPVAKAFLSALG